MGVVVTWWESVKGCRENVYVFRNCPNRGNLRIDENPRTGTKKEACPRRKPGGGVKNKECKE